MPDIDWTPVYNEFMRLVEENYTNEEWFCQLPTEEKAEVIANIWERGYVSGQLDFDNNCGTKYWVEWLKQPHTEKE